LGSFRHTPILVPFHGWRISHRFTIPLLVYPLYLFKRSPSKKGSDFLPGSPIFKPSEKWDVLTSTGALVSPS